MLLNGHHSTTAGANRMILFALPTEISYLLFTLLWLQCNIVRLSQIIEVREREIENLIELQMEQEWKNMNIQVTFPRSTSQNDEFLKFL